MDKRKKSDELIVANKELSFQNEEKEKRATELNIANKELLFQNNEKEKQSAELIFVKDTLIASEIRYRRLFETAKDGIIILDADTGMIMDVNPFLIEKLGYSKEQFLEKEIWEIGFLKDIVANKDKFLELQQKEYVRYEDLPLKTVVGKQINVEFVSNVYLVNNHKVIQCNIRDITERKHAEKALQQSEHKFRNYIENMPDGIFVADEKGNYLEVNKAACRITGYTEIELLGMTIMDITPSEFLDEAGIQFFKVMNTGSGYCELHYKHKNGTYRIWSIDGVKVSDTRILGFVKDITDRKRAEALVQINYSIQTTLNSILQLSIENVPLTELLKQTLVMILDIPNLNFESKGCIFLLNEDTHELEMAVEKNLSEPLKKICKSVLLGFCNCGRAASTQKIQFSKHTDKKQDITSDGIADHSDYCVPIVYRGITLGVINIELRPDHLKNKTEIDFLNAIANTLAGIIVRRNNEKELQTTLENLEIKVIRRTEELNRKNSELKEEIEERTITENKLTESEEKYRNLIEDAVDTIFQNDSEGNFIGANSASLLLTGYSKDEFLKMKNENLFKREDLKSNPMRYDLLDLGKILHEERTLVRKDKKEIPIEIKAKKMPDGTYQTIIRDISERKRFEKELKQSKESAEDANWMKSEFLANMSHEIRTPLNAIVGFSSILKEKAAGQKIFTEYLDNIIQSGKVLLSLINDILDLSKVEAGRMIIDYQPVNLNNIILELQSVFLMKAKEKGLSINIQISKDIPGNIITDEKYLRQILFNLIGNAIKFTNKGGVDISVNIISKDSENCKVDLVITVKDTGIGIPADKLTAIFDPFVQVEQKNRSKYGGTGLGLSITKRLIELLGGTINVESVIDKGSVFNIIVFDIEIASFHSDENTNNVAQHLSKIKFFNPIILMAEDVLSNRQVVRGYLETLNITIVETVNGEDCIVEARKNKPDLILMDMQMPVMDGFTAINILKSADELKNIPVIALSASGMKQQKDMFEKVADDFLLKPIYKNELLEKLIKYLPYEELPVLGEGVQAGEISSGQIQVAGENKLPDEFKKEIDQTFLLKIVEFDEALNFGELLTFITALEKTNEKYQNSLIKDYGEMLNQYAESFNIKQIQSCLKQLSEFINK